MSISIRREAFQRSPRKLIRAASLQLRSVVHGVLHKRLRLRGYKIQMIHAIKPSDRVARTNFTEVMLERNDASPNFLFQVCFSDEATFQDSGVVHRYNCRIWGSQNPHVTCESEKGGPNLNVWTGLMRDKQIGQFSFSEYTVTGRSFLDMLKLYALPHLSLKLSSNKTAHFCHHVRNHLDREMAGRLIGRGGPIAWPPRSPDLTPMDFLLWGYVKNTVYQVKINDIQYLKARIREAGSVVTPNIHQAI
ncbi:hypothetical protein B7P43_G07422 [Cryptotermes secundus]|uniref:Tc1-like transposase DDE domain-containing protein n=1 Tax=Cryptotermes secundus TaxID=105785 RepID=A0A2J7RAK5_9NEOP|nr:hypothetical protein B7P43_G07422 [Cryptotermes secundus]